MTPASDEAPIPAMCTGCMKLPYAPSMCTGYVHRLRAPGMCACYVRRSSAPAMYHGYVQRLCAPGVCIGRDASGEMHPLLRIHFFRSQDASFKSEALESIWRKRSAVNRANLVCARFCPGYSPTLSVALHLLSVAPRTLSVSPEPEICSFSKN